MRNVAIHINDVTVNKINAATNNELSDEMFRVCSYCDKIVSINLEDSYLNSSRTYYCPFCLRHRYHLSRHNSNILTMSFRGIIAYYYRQLYLADNFIYVNDIDKIIQGHQETGLENPVFNYDYETMLWFIDFSRIGDMRGKIPFEDVTRTTKAIFDCFEVDKLINRFREKELWQKFSRAVVSFEKTGNRPKNRRFLIPTVDGKKSAKDKNFTKCDLILK